LSENLEGKRDNGWRKEGKGRKDANLEFSSSFSQCSVRGRKKKKTTSSHEKKKKKEKKKKGDKPFPAANEKRGAEKPGKKKKEEERKRETTISPLNTTDQGGGGGGKKHGHCKKGEKGKGEKNPLQLQRHTKKNPARQRGKKKRKKQQCPILDSLRPVERRGVGKRGLWEKRKGEKRGKKKGEGNFPFLQQRPARKGGEKKTGCRGGGREGKGKRAFSLPLNGNQPYNGRERRKKGTRKTASPFRRGKRQFDFALDAATTRRGGKKRKNLNK